METYLKSILFFTLLSAVIQQMLPGENYRRIVGMVCGFLMVLVFLKPLLSGIGLQEQIVEEFGRIVQENSGEEGEFAPKQLDEAVTSQYQKQVAILVESVTKGEGCTVKVIRRQSGGVGSQSISRIVIDAGQMDKTSARQVKKLICETYSLEESKVEIR